MINTPSSNIEDLEGLNEAQLAILKILEEAGCEGIHMTDFFHKCSSIGVTPNDFDELLLRKLVSTKFGNKYIHPDYI